jgi:hypothetical protein
MSAFLKNAAIRAALTAIFVPALIILLGGLAAMWGQGSFAGDYPTLFAIAAAAGASGAVSWLTMLFGKKDSGSFIE